MSGARWDTPDERRSFVWQSSHIGAPMSEWAELEARAAGADGAQLAEARQAEDADGSSGGGQARLEAREGQEGERPAGQPPQAGNPVAATRFIPLLPLSQTIPADEEQYGMLIEQLMDPLNGGPQWPYYFRRSYGTPRRRRGQHCQTCWRRSKVLLRAFYRVVVWQWWVEVSQDSRSTVRRMMLME